MRMRYALVVLAFVALPNAAVAFPISPQTIWSLTWRAEKIVLARVDSVVDLTQENKKRGPDEAPQRAKLEVLETWKGEHTPDLEVSFDSYIVCPAPEVYEPGKRVVAFLTWQKGRWVTVARSYGTRYPVGDGAEGEYRRSVQLALKEQQGLPAAREGEHVPAPARSWSLAAIEGRATRWDGVYALSSDADPAHAFYDRVRGVQPAPLSEELLAQLGTILVRTPSYDSTLPQLLTLLKNRKSAAVTQAAVDAVETTLQGASADYWMPETFDLIAERLGGERAEPPVDLDAKSGSLDKRIATEAKLASRGSRKRPSVKQEETAQQRWEALKLRYKLTPKVRDDFQRAPRTATGGDTTL
jgi:hypothetical protein